jgi:hypothetical protein
MLVTFESWPGFQLELTTFDPARQPPELLAVRESVRDDQVIQLATVFIPQGSLGYFLRRFQQYGSEDTPTGKPKLANMVERIAGLQLASLEALWTDAAELFPAHDKVVWWEVWLRRSDGQEVDRLRSFVSLVDIEIGERRLVFDNRIIVDVRATADQLSSALDIIDDFAELRFAHTPTAFFTGLSPFEQAEWVEELLARTEFADGNAPAACIFDTGVNRAHPLLEQALPVTAMHTCDPAWGTHDHDGHGTGMAGLALFGDLRAALDAAGTIRLSHQLESVKLLPPPGSSPTPPDLYGAVTAEGVARTEIAAPQRRRAFSMSITAANLGAPGAPTSWSAAVDALAAGRDFDTVNGELRYIDSASSDAHRLFVVSAGNVGSPDATYLTQNDLAAVEDPAQAWNALTVGAFTELCDVTASGGAFAQWSVIAPRGDLSPFSRTSVSISGGWPNKPEVVFEGGNAAISPSGSDVDWPDSLQLLTTAHALPSRLFTTTNATSAATAQASHMAAVIAAEYPVFWPETVRGLIVHAAEWTPAMLERFTAVGSNKQQRSSLLRRYGYGVPALDRCLRSATNALTLIAQDTIHPYQAGKLREMHTHDLPWPANELASLGDLPVRLRVSLSYFVEPNPTRRGQRTRYRYASHQLRFEMKQPTETNDEFHKRLNRRALDEEEQRPVTDGSLDGWYLGPTARNRGSLHADIWNGTATDLANRGRVAVYPVSGWWKERRSRDRSDLGARYSLIISIDSPTEDVDLWTPVAQAVGLPVAIEIPIGDHTSRDGLEVTIGPWPPRLGRRPAFDHLRIG